MRWHAMFTFVSLLVPATVLAEGFGVAGLSVTSLGRPEPGWWPPSLEYYSYSYERGELRMTGVLIKPQGNGPFPGVVFNHGGGSTARIEGIEYGSQFALGGYVSITCNGTHSGLERMSPERRPRRGSPSEWTPEMSARFGEVWNNEDNFRRAGANLDVLAALPFVDGKKLAMAGHSMGGFLTLEMLKRSDKIKVAWINAAGSRFHTFASPGDGLESIQAPVILVAGEEDNVVPLPTVIDLKRRLDAAGKRSKLLVFPGERHNVLKDRINTVFENVLDWFDYHLGRPRRPQRSLLPPAVVY